MLDIIDKWNKTYPKIWQGMGFLDVTETFGEVSKEPMTEHDLSLLQSEIQEVEKLNCDFLTMAFARAELLVQNELGPDPGRAKAA